MKEEIDCLERFEQTLEARGLITRAQMDAAARAATRRSSLEARSSVRDEPQPEPERIWDYVFADKNLVGGEG